MQDWKQPIADRIGLPRVDEGVFNAVWDQFNPTHQQILVKGDSHRVDMSFLRGIFQEVGWVPMRKVPFNCTDDVKMCAANMEFGDKRYVGLVTKQLVDLYSGKTSGIKSPAERKKQAEDVALFIENYRENAVHMILFGYDLRDIVPEELDRELPKEWKARVVWLDHLVGLFDEANGVPEVSSFTGPFQCFSNFFESQVKLDGMEFNTVEAAFQAAKTLDFDKRREISTLAPHMAKRVGRNVLLRPEWESIKEPIMLHLLLQKFAPGTNFRRILMSTKGRHICEGNTWHDNIWGDCTCPDCRNKPGKNLMGKLLMYIRDTPLVDIAMKYSVKERFAIILEEEWLDLLENNDTLCKDILSAYRCTGILVHRHGPRTLYHLTTPENVKKIFTDGKLTPSGKVSNTFDGDVIYAYPDKRLEGDGILLEVQVRSYFQAIVVEDKPEEEQGECIFFPEEVISFDEV